MGNKLPEEITDDIKTEANKIYWETHKASISRDPYCRGLTMFEVAQVPLINALTAKEVKYRELKDQAQRMADALAEIAESNCDYESMNYAKALHSPECRACKAKEILQQFKDGKGKEVLYICPCCNGDGKETCTNPDHGFIEAIPGDISRLGCPVCGHDPKHKVKNGSACTTCNGTGKVSLELFKEFCEETGYDNEPELTNPQK